jgi:type II secretory pathway pseudopilin PulG
MAAASYSTAQKKGRDSRRTGDMKAIQDAFEQYYSANSNAYPTTCSSGSTITIMTGTTFLIPTDPKSPTYNYTSAGGCTATAYCICAQLENTTSGNSTNTSCNWGAGTYYCIKSRQ